MVIVSNSHRQLGGSLSLNPQVAVRVTPIVVLLLANAQFSRRLSKFVKYMELGNVMVVSHIYLLIGFLAFISAQGSVRHYAQASADDEDRTRSQASNSLNGCYARYNSASSSPCPHNSSGFPPQYRRRAPESPDENIWVWQGGEMALISTSDSRGNRGPLNAFD
ncbi:sugar transporter family protein [Aspergillus luchuensis]|uniref:Sugar transporter family protein n=1 Tax=Aspergillus kawachii TaxID=1069201 RepID=A0A146G042_ASPKA|nr:sugar transporter family protein [Aspergillus luchuensis]